MLELLFSNIYCVFLKAQIQAHYLKKYKTEMKQIQTFA